MNHGANECLVEQLITVFGRTSICVGQNQPLFHLNNHLPPPSAATPAYYAHKLAFRARFYDPMAASSDSGSMLSGGGGGNRREGGPGMVQALPPLQPEVKNAMFFT